MSTNWVSPDLRGLLRISVPMMLTMASESVMLFVDRVYLGNFSVDAMNAAAATWLMTAVFVFSLVAVCGISEVLAGQANGRSDYKQVGHPIWQAFWLSVFSCPFFFMLSFWGKAFLIPESFHNAGGYYFELLTSFAPLWGINVALSGFFAATGRPKIVTIVTIISNIINIILDPIFIFGWGDIPSLGATGAALATIISQVIHFIVLLFLFVSHKNRSLYNTLNYNFNFNIFSKLLRIGIPNAISHGIEILAWAMLFQMVAKVSKDHTTVMTVAQSILGLFMFANEGLKQGVIAISANLLGAKRYSDITTLLFSGFKFQTCLFIVLLIPFIVFPGEIVSLYGDLGDSNYVKEQLQKALIFAALFLFLDGMVWVINGILTAAGDTKVTMLINISTVWIFAILPVWIFVVKFKASPWVTLIFPVTYAFSNIIGHYLRFKQKKWLNV